MGEEIEHPIYGFKTRVVAIYKDLLGNERILTEHAKRHVEMEIDKDERWKKTVRQKGLEELENILAKPDIVVEDKEREALILAKAMQVKGRKRYAGVVLPMSNKSYILTVQPMSGTFREDRYIKLYEREVESGD